MSRVYIMSLLFILSSLTLVFSQDFTKKEIEHAKIQRQNGDYIEALNYFKKILNSDSNKVEYLWEYAETLRLYKDYKQAEWYYSKVFEKEEANLYKESILYLGLMQKHNMKYELAIENFKKAKKKYANNKKNYLYLKASQELESTLWAKKALKDVKEYKINQFDKFINTTDSEFGHTILNNKLYFSSLKSDSVSISQEIISKDYKNNIYNSDLTKKINQPFINKNPNLHLANGTFSLDKKSFYFTACKEVNSNFICTIVKAELENEKIVKIDTLDDVINEEGANTTMPNIALFDGKEALFFSSNRSESKGGMDIFYSFNVNGEFQKVFPVESINTIDNEISPFYDSKEKKLYFSSNWHYGFGGFDVFYTTFENYKFQAIKNLGLPANSPANDMYFFIHNDTNYFSSNRLGSTFVNNPTCCTDIFYYTEIQEIKQKTVENASIVITSGEFKTLEELNNKLPVTLYFHNDVPNPKSIDTTTNLNYLSTYDEYVKLIPQYKKEYSKGLNPEKTSDAIEDIESFFVEFVHQGVKDLTIFTELLLKELKNGNSIVISVKGFASPLAKSDYNVNLTKRRIASLKNYFAEIEEGVFLPYLEKDSKVKLTFQEIPFGEYVADKLVSDNPNDLKNSVFSRAAGLERKIEIQSASILKNDSINPLIAKKQLQDLGSINQNDQIKLRFEIKNTSSREIEIDKIDIPCVCNSATIDKMKFKPNEKGILEMTFDSKGYSGKVVKSVYIYTKNSKDALRLIMTGDVK